MEVKTQPQGGSGSPPKGRAVISLLANPCGYEKGCIAAAYMVMAMAGAGMPPEEEMDFVLDRPFIFIITSDSGLPLFAGIVNEP